MREIKLKVYYKNHESEINISIIKIEKSDKRIFMSSISFSENTIIGIEEYTGLSEKDNEIYSADIYSETDQGRKMLFIVTWINEYAAFAMLTPIEFEEYKKIGAEVIEKSFEGFYVQLHRESFQKMKYEGNIYENPELLS